MKTLKKSLSLFLVLALFIGIVSITASAGAAIQTIGLESYEGGLQTSVWHNSTADITVTEDNKIIFPKEGTSATKLICKQVAKRSTVYEKLLDVDSTLCFKSLPSGQTFNMGFSLNTIEATIGEAGNIEIEFSNKGGITAALKIYDDGGNAKTVATKHVGSLGAPIKVTAGLTVNNEITVDINGVNFCTKYKTGVDVVGRVGFIQTGSCNVEISDVAIKTYAYDLPENTNIFEDFNDYNYNKNIFDTGINYSSGTPAGVYVEEYEGQGALYVSNPTVAWLTTMHEYSNVEIEYDVLFQQNYEDYYDDGTKKSGKVNYHTIAFGYDITNVDGWGSGMDGYVRAMVGSSGGINFVGGGQNKTFKSENHAISAEENSKKGYSVKLRMLDGVFTAFLKWRDEKEYTEIGTVDISNYPTPKGFVHFRFANGINLVFDNIKITNLDAEPNIVEVDYVGNKYPEAHHAEYKKPKVVYKDFTKASAGKDAEGFNFYLITVIAAGACVVAFGATYLALVVVKKKKAKAALAAESAEQPIAADEKEETANE